MPELQVIDLQQLGEAALAALGGVVRPLVGFGLGVLVVYVAGRLVVGPIVTRLVEARNVNPTAEQGLRRFLRIGALAAGLVVGLVVAGYGHVLGGSQLIIAAVTLAVGVAGQDVIGNVVSGAFLVVDPDFNVGDWIEWDDQEGSVEEIGFRVTRVRTIDNEVVTVPNTVLTTSAITNPYVRNRYRVTETLDIGYDEDLATATGALLEEAKAHPDILPDPSPTVRFVEFGAEEYVGLQVRFWIPDPTQRDVVRIRSEYARHVKERFDAEDIRMRARPEHVLSGHLEVSLPDE